MSDQKKMKRKPRECTICKYYGKRNAHNPSKEVVYDENNTPIVIHLCRHHAIELFKLGQRRFFLKHFAMANDVIGSDESKFLDLLLRTASKELLKQ